MPLCHVLHVAGKCLAQTQNSVRRPHSPMVACNPLQSGCNDACSSSYPGWPGCSSRHDGFAPQTITDRSQFPWVAWMKASFSVPPSLWHTRALPSLWCRENLDSSLKMQCLQWRRSQTRCICPHSRRCRLFTKVSLGHLRRTPGPIFISQKSVYNNSGSHAPAETLNDLHPRKSNRNETVHLDHTKQVTVFTRHEYPPRLGRPAVYCTAGLLLMHCGVSPRIRAITDWVFPLPVLTTRQFSAKRPPANFAAWCSNNMCK